MAGPSHAALSFLMRLSGRVALFVVAFVLLFAYATARPGIESLFLEVHSEKALPWVWAATMPAVAIAVAVYGALSYRLTLIRTFIVGLVLSGSTLVMLLLWYHTGQTREATFLLYIWKDVHVVVLLEMFWTFANLTHAVGEARSVYGLFLCSGSLGGVAGNLLAGRAAAAFGTLPALLLPLIPLVLLLLLSIVVVRVAPPRITQVGATGVDTPSVADAWATLRQSRYLPWLLTLVLVVQVVITLVDYRYNEMLIASYPLLDARTAIKGEVYATIDGVSLLLQLLTGPILRIVGVRAALVAIPALVGATVTVLAFGAAPRFAAAAAAKILTKGLDYSLFRAAKEILYIPLGSSEQTRGKAVVDMFGYRSGKAGASLILGLLVQAGFASGAISLATAVFTLLWLAVTLVVVTRFRPGTQPV